MYNIVPCVTMLYVQEFLKFLQDLLICQRRLMILPLYMAKLHYLALNMLPEKQHATITTLCIHGNNKPLLQQYVHSNNIMFPQKQQLSIETTCYHSNNMSLQKQYVSVETMCLYRNNMSPQQQYVSIEIICKYGKNIKLQKYSSILQLQ